MPLVLELNDTEEREIEADARREGVSVHDYLRRVVSDRNRTLAAQSSPRVSPDMSPADADLTERDADAEIRRMQALILQWQPQDGTRTSPPAPNDGTMTPSEALFRKWEQEDAKLTEEERQAEKKFWHDYQEGINEARIAAGMRTIF